MNTPPALTMTSRDWGLLWLLSLLWGGAFVLARHAVQDIPPMTLVALRCGLAAITLLIALIILRQKLPFTRRFVLASCILGLLNNALPFGLLFWAQTHIPAGLAAILTATMPFFTIVVAHLATLDEKITPAKLSGLVLGFIGVGLLLGKSAFSGAQVLLLAEIAALTAAFLYAVASIFGRRFMRQNISPYAASFAQLTAATVLIAPLALFIEMPWQNPMPRPTAIGAVAILGIFSTALAYVLYFRLIKTAGATNVSLVTLLNPVSAVLLGMILLNEWITLQQLSGLGLIGFGLLIIDGRILRQIKI